MRPGEPGGRLGHHRRTDSRVLYGIEEVPTIDAQQRRRFDCADGRGPRHPAQQADFTEVAARTHRPESTRVARLAARADGDLTADEHPQRIGLVAFTNE